ncbi:hybrid sensor histidine kinase/response regulator [Thalassotalea marina]|uniref:Hybrid sensor histidine kinase/response regulator n=1 Tax=Thalassotalea marina TaxID=1673741 RepID=A0A919BR42_9GAMM|nr:hybrid sensor histidine kinase/response regulator [Thalassotalea marina]
MLKNKKECILKEQFIHLLSVVVMVILLLINNRAMAHAHLKKLDIALSQNTVGVAVQDHSGVLWLGTANGVDRFDGYQLSTYNQLEKSCQLPSRQVLSMLVDNNNALWVGTSNGMAVKQNNHNCFKWPTSVQSNQRISHLLEDSQGRIWATGNVILLSSADKQSFRLIAEADISYENSLDIVATGVEVQSAYSQIFEDSQGRVWLVGYNGLSLFNESSQQFDSIFSPTLNETTKRTHHFLHIVEFEQKLWLAGKQGVFSFDPNTHISSYYTFFKNDDQFKENNFVTQLHIDSQNNLWVGTFNGLQKFDNNKGNFNSLLSAEQLSSDNQISNNRIGTILSSTDGTLWVSAISGIYNQDAKSGKLKRVESYQDVHSNLNGGNVPKLLLTRSGAILIKIDLDGLYWLTPNNRRFSHVLPKQTHTSNFDNNIIRAIYEDPLTPSTLWIGLDGAGIKKLTIKERDFGLHFIEESERFRHHHAPKDSGQIGEYIHAITRAPDNTLWAATNFGLRVFNEKQNNFVEANIITDSSHPKNLLVNSKTYTLLNDEERNIFWFAGDGFFGYQDYHDQSKPVIIWTEENAPALKDNAIHKLYKDQQGNLWLAGTTGLIRFTTELQHFQSIDLAKAGVKSTDIWVHGIWQASERTFWLATRGGGLLQMSLIPPNANTNPSQAIEWKHFGLADGLKDTMLYSLLADNDKNLWLTSNKGIAKFDTQTTQFSHYTPSDGVQGWEFNYGVGHIGASGTYYFGGINGINIFQPQNVKKNLIPPIVSLKQAFLHEQPLSQIDDLDFSYKENYLTFEFVGIFYAEQQDIRYQFKLTGLDDEWINAGKERKARYNALPPGQYIFEVKAANKDGIWSEPTTLASFTVHPAPWLSQEAYLFYGFLVFLMIYFYHMWRDRTEQKLKQKVSQATLDLARTNEHIRLQFQSFAHEVKTPLMSVNNHCNIALREVSKAQQLGNDAQQQMILTSIQAAISSLEDIRAGVRQELNLAELRIKCDYKTIDLLVSDIVNQVLSTRTNRLAERELTIHLSIPEQAAIHCQPGTLDLVLDNLLDNAIEHTPKNGTITLSAIQKENVWQFSIDDSGPGIPISARSQVFTCGYRINSANFNANHCEGRGMGLYLVKAILDTCQSNVTLTESKLGGCRFTFALPVAKAQPELLYFNKLPEPINIDHIKSDEKNKDMYTVLLVEDNADLRQSLNYLLSETYQIILAENAVQGFKLANKHQPDIIVTDISMETKTAGIDLVRQLKSDDSLSHIPVIVCSAFGDTTTRLAALDSMADIFLDKNSDITMLERHLHNLSSQMRRVEEKVKQSLKASMTTERKIKNTSTEVSQESERKTQFIETIKALICEHFTNYDITVEQLAGRYLKCSIRTVQHNCRLYLPQELSVKALLNGYRGVNAMIELIQTEHQIKRICIDVGFNNERQMSRWFATHLKVTPSQFRKVPNEARYSSELYMILDFFNMDLATKSAE